MKKVLYLGLVLVLGTLTSGCVYRGGHYPYGYNHFHGYYR